MKKETPLFLLLCCLMVISGVLCPMQSYGQERIISGTVTSASDRTPLPGTNILVKGTSIGTTSGADGRYELKVPPEARFLVFSFTGFVSQEIELGTQSVIDVALSENFQQLSEVVVIGYGSQEKKEIGKFGRRCFTERFWRGQC